MCSKMLYTKLQLLRIFCHLLQCFPSAKAQSYLSDNYPAAVLEDAKLDTAHLIRKYRYPAETHYVITEDNYILRMHRMPQRKGRPVFLMHGLTDSSSGWIIMGPWSGLAYLLYDNGYDVWLGNARGNRYSRNHTILNPDTDKSFWQFSWHEIGYYDLPAMLDYVLRQTEASKLSYFGHSQGTTCFFVMCSTRPEYNDKVSIMQALAPAVFMRHMKVPLIGLARPFVAAFTNSISEFIPHSNIFYAICLATRAAQDICLEVIMLIAGRHTQQFNMTRFPVILGHIPAGCDLKQAAHYMQLQESDRFCQFDYGSAENMQRYGKLQPPDYTLENVTAPVALYYAHNDYLVSVEDVQRLVRSLPNVVENHLYPYKEWNHITVMWGINARELAHRRMLQILRKFSE